MNESIENFNIRLNKILSDRNIRPVELAEKTGLSKSTISHYMSGYTKPKSDKLFILAKALNVSEAWLIGYDVPMERTLDTKHTEHINIDTIVFEITGRSLQYSPRIYDTICRSLDSILCDRNDKRFNSSHGRLNILSVLRETNISYDEKASALRSIIDMILFDVKKNEIKFFYKLYSDPRESQTDKLMCITRKLNTTGLDKVIDYATDLSTMVNYCNKTNDENVISLSGNPNTNYFDPKAAHERTDIEVTDEMKKHDDDIMNDDKFWK